MFVLLRNLIQVYVDRTWNYFITNQFLHYSIILIVYYHQKKVGILYLGAGPP